MSTGCGSDGVEPDLAYLRAKNAEAAGRFDWARVYYAEDLVRHPKRIESIRGEAFAWFGGDGGGISQGTERLSRYLELRPDDMDAVRRYVSSLLTLGETQKAEEWSLTLDDDPASLVLRAEVILMDDPTDAILLADQSLESAGDSAGAYWVKARALEQLDRTDEAIEATRSAIDRACLRPDYRAQLGRLLQSRGLADEAREAQGLFELVRELRAGNLEPGEELDLLGEIEELSGSTCDTLRKHRAALLLRAGRIDEAGPEIDRMVADRSLQINDHLVFARLYVTARRVDDARRHYESALETDPQNVTARTSLALIDYGDGKTVDAQDRLRTAIELHPNSAPDHGALADIEFSEGRIDEASRHYRRALELAPWEHGWRISLADILYAQGHYESARAILDEAPENHPALHAYRHRRFGERG